MTSDRTPIADSYPSLAVSVWRGSVWNMDAAREHEVYDKNPHFDNFCWGRVDLVNGRDNLNPKSDLISSSRTKPPNAST